MTKINVDEFYRRKVEAFTKERKEAKKKSLKSVNQNSDP
jgi:hypothetical protein